MHDEGRAGTDGPSVADDPTLTRSLGLWQVTISGVGIVIAVYVLIGEAASVAGSFVWASFILAALLAALTGLAYAELSGLFPTAGAEFEFARRAFNEFTAFLVGWLMLAGNLIGAGAVALGFAAYFRRFVEMDARVIAVALLLVLALAIWSGVRLWIWLTVILVVLEVGGLVAVMAIGLPHVGERSVTDGELHGVLSAAGLVFFAYIGFDEVVTLSEETKNPARVIPRALLLALAITTLLYVATSIAATSAVDWHTLAASERPLVLVLEMRLGSSAGEILAVLALASTASTSMLLLTASSRLMFHMARTGSLPRALAKVAGSTGAPYVAVGMCAAVAALFALVGRIGLVAAVTDFSVYAVFLVVDLAVLRLRQTAPDLPRLMTAGPSIGRWPVAPVLGLIATVALASFLEVEAWLVGLSLTASGVLVWLLRRWLVRPAALRG